MKKSLAIIPLLLASCETINVKDIGAHKQIEYGNPPVIAFPREAAFATKEVDFAMQITSAKQCPEGYRVMKKQYDKEKDVLLWDIKCISPTTLFNH